MSEGNAPLTSAPAPADARPGLFSRLANLFFSPASTFKAIQEKPDWIVPALLFAVVMALFGYIQVTDPGLIKAQREMMEQMMEKMHVPAEQVAQQMEAGQARARITTPLGAFLGPVIMLIFIGSGIWLFVSNVVFGAKSRYAQMLGVTSYTALITALGTLVKLPIMVAKGELMVHFSIATFLPATMSKTFIYTFLMFATDIFNIWTIAVLSIGIAVVANLKTSKVWPVVLIVTVVYYAASAAMMTMFS
jgi:hypothetical protein